MGCTWCKPEEEIIDDDNGGRVWSNTSSTVRQDAHPRTHIQTVDARGHSERARANVDNRVNVVGGDALDELLYRESFQPSQRSIHNRQPQQQNRSNDNNRRSRSRDDNDRRSVVRSRGARTCSRSSSVDNYKSVNNEADVINGNIEPISRSDKLFNILNTLSYPPEWSSGNTNKINYVNIPFNSDEGISVQKMFKKTSCTKKFKLFLKGITRIENKFLYCMYLLRKQEMESRNGHTDELILYHGTKTGNVTSICENNLNWRMFSKSHKFGQGISFSPYANYSSHYSDESDRKVLLLCKVLISNVTIGTANMIIPPVTDGITYDTSIKDNASVIVKYCDNEYYPMYKIMCTKVDN